MGISNVLELLGGVALFLFGMALMGDSLKKVAGNKLELILFRLSSTPLKGILLGTGVTAVIQSSSATSVMVVGFVNSGMMKVRQAIGVVMGAIIGTSITGWIICLSDIGGGSSGWLELLSTDTLTAVIAVIGIVLLVLLALLILTVLAVLFVPIRYRASGEKEADRIEGVAAVSFLYPILSFKWQRTGNENRWALRLLGVRLKSSRKADKDKAAEPEKTEKGKAAEPVKEEAKQPVISNAQNAETGNAAQQTGENGTQETDRASSETGSAGDKTSEKRAADKQEKGTETKARFTISGLCDKMENIRDNVEYYKERLTAEENRLFLKRTKERIFAVLKSIKPKVLTARIVCGTGSPDTTGYVCAVYGMLYPVIEDRISFTADFENKVLDGELSVKGKVRVATLVRHGIKILLDKQLKVFLKEMKRED